MENDDLEKIILESEDTKVEPEFIKYKISSSDSYLDITLDTDIEPTWSVDNIVFNNSDSTYGLTPENTNPEVYTSYVQREQHDKYPALKKAWDDYIAMYNMTQGEPPIVD